MRHLEDKVIVVEDISEARGLGGKDHHVHTEITERSENKPVARILEK